MTANKRQKLANSEKNARQWILDIISHIFKILAAESESIDYNKKEEGGK